MKKSAKYVIGIVVVLAIIIAIIFGYNAVMKDIKGTSFPVRHYSETRSCFHTNRMKKAASGKESCISSFHIHIRFRSINKRKPKPIY